MVNPEINLEVARLVERINSRHRTSFKPVGRYLEGENQGAYRLKDSSTEIFVLKWNYRPDWLTQLELAREITANLRKFSPLVPEYVLVGAFLEAETYWVQTALPGNPASSLTITQAQDLIRFNELQAGRVLFMKQNWSNYIASVVFEDVSGWKYTLHNYSLESNMLLNRLEGFVYGLEEVCNKASDIVHGDLTPGNILLENGRVSGVVDWDATGCGDRAFDLALLFFYSYENPPVREILFKHIIELSGIERLKVYTTYSILSQLDWSIRHHPKEGVIKFTALANLIISDFEAL